MKQTHASLGKLEGPVLVFGGPYSNFQALKALYARAHVLKIPPRNIICTGDIVAYYAQPQECIDLIRVWGIHVVQGNCETSIGYDEDDCGCGFEENSACDLASKEWFSFSRQRVTSDAKAWMRDLPFSMSFEFQNKIYHCIHGAHDVQNAFVFASTGQAEKQRAFDAVNADVIIGGHCGLPFTSEVTDDKLWLNAGVIGMPANDGSPQTWYMLISPSSGADEEQKKDEQNKSAEVSWHRLEYDYAKTIETMQDEKLAKGYQESLQTGLWPNMDILPQAERLLVGRPLQLPNLNIGPII